MYTRRRFLATSAIAAAGIGLAQPSTAGTSGAVSPLNTRAIPSTGEKIPVIGMGTSGSFEVGQSPAELDPLREVLKRFFAAGATVIDTAPTYSVAEDVMGALLAEQGLTARRGWPPNSPA